MSKRKSYTDEFKTMIAELVLSGKTPKEVASEYSISETAVRNWVKKKAPINVVEGDTTNLVSYTHLLFMIIKFYYSQS